MSDKQKENPRRTAVKLLSRLEKSDAYSNILLDEHFRRSSMDKRDKAFCTALFYGTLERRLTLDMIIAKYQNKPTQKMSDDVRNILRTAIYQLMYMDSVPESAAVNEAVNLAAKERNPAVKGFVNGVLRTFLREGKPVPEPMGYVQKLSAAYSCPVPLVKKWTEELGEKAAARVLADSLGRPPVTVRVNTLKTDTDKLSERLQGEGFGVKTVQHIENALQITGASPENSPAFKEGLFHVQDVSCMLCCKALDVQEGMTVLDMCAAPGGKTFTLAQMMNDKGKLYAFDLHEKRVRLIADGAQRLGLTCIETAVNDAKIFNERFPLADRVLCDVPCSGLGVIRRKPEIKYKDLTGFDKLPGIQYNILDVSANYVKPGGIMVYSTCTLSRAENEEAADRFLKEHEDFEPCVLWEDGGRRFEKAAQLTVLPEYFDSDGFFIAKFKRRDK